MHFSISQDLRTSKAEHFAKLCSGKLFIRHEYTFFNWPGSNCTLQNANTLWIEIKWNVHNNVTVCLAWAVCTGRISMTEGRLYRVTEPNCVHFALAQWEITTVANFLDTAIIIANYISITTNHAK